MYTSGAVSVMLLGCMAKQLAALWLAAWMQRGGYCMSTTLRLDRGADKQHSALQ